LGPAEALEEEEEEAMTAQEAALATRLAEVAQGRKGSSNHTDNNPEDNARREEDEKLTPQEKKLADALEAPLQVRICLNTEKVCGEFEEVGLCRVPDRVRKVSMGKLYGCI
jgi:hypothetical protein